MTSTCGSATENRDVAIGLCIEILFKNSGAFRDRMRPDKDENRDRESETGELWSAGDGQISPHYSSGWLEDANVKPSML